MVFKMENEMTTFERRMQILSLLKTNKYISRLELARIFDVSNMAISRDITALSGIAPISSTHGRYGGIYFISGYDKNKVYLTRDEEELLTNLMNEMEGKDRLLIKLILHKFAMPN